MRPRQRYIFLRASTCQLKQFRIMLHNSGESFSADAAHLTETWNSVLVANTSKLVEVGEETSSLLIDGVNIQHDVDQDEIYFTATEHFQSPNFTSGRGERLGREPGYSKQDQTSVGSLHAENKSRNASPMSPPSARVNELQACSPVLHSSGAEEGSFGDACLQHTTKSYDMDGEPRLVRSDAKQQFQGNPLPMMHDKYTSFVEGQSDGFQSASERRSNKLRAKFERFKVEVHGVNIDSIVSKETLRKLVPARRYRVIAKVECGCTPHECLRELWMTLDKRGVSFCTGAPENGLHVRVPTPDTDKFLVVILQFRAKNHETCIVSFKRWTCDKHCLKRDEKAILVAFFKDLTTSFSEPSPATGAVV